MAGTAGRAVVTGDAAARVAGSGSGTGLNGVRERIGVLALLTVFAGAFVAIRFAGRFFPPGAMALMRFGVASVLLAVYLMARRGRIPRPAWRDVPGLAASGLFGITLYHLALNAGERSVSAGAAGLLVNTTPIFAALLAMVALRERPCPRAIAGIGIGFAGAAIVSLGKSSGGLVLDRGALLVIGAGISAAVYYVIEKPYLRRYPPLDVTAWGFWAGTALLLPYGGQLAGAVRTAPLSAILAVVWLGVFPAAIGYVAWSHVLARMEVAKAAALLYLIPPLAALLGWSILGEPLGVKTAVGGSVTIGGVALVNARRKPTRVRDGGEAAAAGSAGVREEGAHRPDPADRGDPVPARTVWEPPGAPAARDRRVGVEAAMSGVLRRRSVRDTTSSERTRAARPR
jgi:drug/metabolite transporter (DMT)-like permease